MPKQKIAPPIPESIHVEQIIPRLYSLYVAVPGYTLRDARFTIHGQMSESFCRSLDYHLISTLADHLRYLKTHYHPRKVIGENRIIFPDGGCINSLTWDAETMTAHAVYRKRSEWFRKFHSDLLYIRHLLKSQTGLNFDTISFDIPILWLRSHDLPLMVRYFRDQYGRDLSEKHMRECVRLLALYNFKAVLSGEKRSIIRRYFLRHYLLEGQLTKDQFRWHARKHYYNRRPDENNYDPYWDDVESNVLKRPTG